MKLCLAISPSEMSTGPQKIRIPSSVASSRFGITNDYVTLLCRQKKIDGVLYGRDWFVDPESLSAFLKKTEAEKKAKREALAEKLRVEYQQLGKAIAANPKEVQASAPLGVTTRSKFIFAGGIIALVLVANAGAFIGAAFNTVSPAAVAQLDSPFFGGGFVSKIFSTLFGAKTEESIPAEGSYHATVYPAASSTSSQVVQNTYPVIERVIERDSSGNWITREALTVMLGDLEESLQADTKRMLGATVNQEFFYAKNFTDADIPDTITASNYLPLTGGTLTGVLNGTDLVLTGNLTVNGAQTLSGAITVPYVTATSTDTASSFQQLLAYASTTLQNFTFVNATGTAATTTAFNTSSFTATTGRFSELTVTGFMAVNATTTHATSTSLFATTLTADTARLTNLTTSAFVATSATTTNATSTTLFATTFAANTASSTNLFAGSATLGATTLSSLTITGVTGPLQAIDGLVSATTTLSPVYGGTGFSSYAPGDILYADTNGQLTTLPMGGNGEVLKVAAGTLAWESDITSGGGGSGAWATTTDSLAIYPSDTSNTVIVGNTSTSTLLSIFEVHGRSYFSNRVGIGTTTPGTTLGVAGSAVISGRVYGQYFTATSTLTASTFPFASTTAISGTISQFTTASSTNLWISGLTNAGLAVNSSGRVYAAATTTFSGPLVYSSGNVTITQSGVATDGYLSTTDWNLFNNKVSSSSLATLLTSSYPFPLTGNATSTLTQFNGGLTAYASSTIGNGTQTGGLTIFGGATTTGNAYFGDSIGVGTTTPASKIAISTTIGQGIVFDSNGTIIGGLYTSAPAGVNVGLSLDGVTNRPVSINNGANSNVLLANGGGNVGIGTTSPTQKLEIYQGSIQLDNNQFLKSRLTTGTSVNVIGYSSGNQTIVGANSEIALGGSVTLQPISAGDTVINIDSDTDLQVGARNLWVVGSTGNVGIGTTSPYAKLSVTGQVVGEYFTATSTIASTFPFASTTAITAENASTTNLTISSVLSSLLKTNATGGVVAAVAGTDYVTPSALTAAYPFPLTGNATSTLTQFNGGLTAYASSTIGGGTQATGLTVRGGATTTGNLAVQGTGTSTFSGNADILGALKVGNSSLYLDSTSIRNLTGNLSLEPDGGNVGIGTTTPQQVFSVSGATSVGLFTSTNGNSNIYVGDSSNNNRLRLAYNSGTDVANINAHDGSYRQLEIDGSPLLLNPTSGGNVGIASSSPYAKLSVTNTGSGPSFLVEDATSPDSTPFIVDAAGNVGIGNPSPSAALDVTGAVEISSTLDVTGTSTLGVLNFNLGWNSSNADIDAIIGGSQGGGFVQAPSAIHLTVGLRENGTSDGFQIVSGGGNYTTDTTYDTLVFEAQAGGAVSIPNGALTVSGAITEGGSAVLSAADIDTCAEFIALVSSTGTCGSAVFSASPTFTGTITAAAATLSSTLTANGTFAANGGVTLGDGGDDIAINSNDWDISGAGVATGLTGITSSGSVTFSGLTANRFVTSGTGGLLGTSATLANLVSSISDVSGSTGTTNLVLSASPTLTGTLTAATANFSGALTGTAGISSDNSVTAVAALGAGDLLAGNTSGMFQYDSSALAQYLQRSSADASPTQIIARKSRGSAASPSVITTGDDLFYLRGYGYDGASFIEGARITFDSEGTIGTGIVPGRMLFYTANSAGTLTQQLEIGSDGVAAFTGAITEAGSAVISAANIDTYSELNAIVGDVTLTHNGLIDSCAEIAALGALETGTCGSLVLSVSPDLTGTVTAAAITMDGVLRIDNSSASYDVWIQGLGGASGDTRNLALLGREDVDDLILNYNSEYDCVSVGGTSCSAALDVSGALEVSSTITASNEIYSTGASSGLFLQDRTFSTKAGFYSSGGIARWWNAATGDVFTLDSGGNAGFDGGITGTTINTGLGAFEHYAMNQHVRTSDTVTFANMTVTSATFDWTGFQSNTNDRATLCLNDSNGAISIDNNGNNCDTSSRRYKYDIDYLELNGLDMVRQFKPVDFTRIRNDKRERGFIAEDMAEIDPMLVWYDEQGRPNSLSEYAIIGAVADAVQELDLNLQALVASSTASSTAQAKSFAESFWSSLFARATAWLADAGNGIADLFATTVHAEVVEAKKVQTDELCVGSVCVTEEEFMSLVQGSGGQNAPAPEPTPEPIPEPTPEPELTPEPETTPESEENPVGEESQEEVNEPALSEQEESSPESEQTPPVSETPAV